MSSVLQKSYQHVDPLRKGTKEGWYDSSRAYLYSQILITPSLPPVTNLLTPPPVPLPSNPGLFDTRLPGCVAGAQLTALTPCPCAANIWCVQFPSWNSRTDTCPSEEAQASRQPDSWGDQETMFTEAVWRAKLATTVHCELGDSRQMSTLPS